MHPMRLLGLFLGALGVGLVVKQAVNDHVAQQDEYFKNAAISRRQMLNDAAQAGPEFAARQALINNTADRWCQDRQRDIHEAPVQSWLSMFLDG